MNSAIENPSSIVPVSANNYAAWLIDLDGTLYRQSFVRSLMAAELLLRGWPAIKILRRFRNEHERMRKAEMIQPGDPFAQQLARTATSLQLSPEEITSVVEDWMIRRPGRWLKRFARHDLLRSIRQFRALGGKTAIVSDYPARDKLAAMGIAELFDIVVACDEAGGPRMLKPNPNGVLMAAERLGVLPRECLVIGDRWDADGEAARQAGMAFVTPGHAMHADAIVLLDARPEQTA